MFEFSIEISKDGKINSPLKEEDARGYLNAFLVLINEDNIVYHKMNEGCVNFNNKEIVISIAINVYPEFNTSKMMNLLSSMDFDEAKEFIGKILAN